MRFAPSLLALLLLGSMLPPAWALDVVPGGPLAMPIPTLLANVNTGSISLPVYRWTPDSSQPLTASFTYSSEGDSPADPGTDFTPVGTVHFAAGQMTATLTIPILKRTEGGGPDRSFAVI
jgi:hypothetical protein